MAAGWGVALGLLLPGAWGQAPATPMAQGSDGTYTLDQTVRAVVLDVTVTDRQGRPVAGLKADQMHVSEDGVAQRVRFFEGPPAHAMPVEPTAGKEGVALLRASGQAPLTLIVLDHISTEPEDLLYAKKQIEEYLRKQPAQLPSPTALMALTSTTILPLSDYTLDRDKLIAAIRSDHQPPSWYVLRDRQPGMKATGLLNSGERLAIYVGVLNELATSLSSYAVRKNLVWVGPGLPAFDQVLAQRADGPQQLQEALRPVVTRLVRSRVAIYPVEPRGLLVTPTEIQGTHQTPTSTALFGSGGDPAERELAFEQMAPETGGRIFRMRNDVGAAIGESVADGAQFYTISYNPANQRYDGSFRRIRVTVDDPLLRVRTTEGYLAVPPERRSADAGAQAMAFALTSNLQYQGVETTATLARAAVPPAVHVVVSTGDLHWITDPADPSRMLATISLVTAHLNRDGKVLDYAVQTQHARAAEAATHGTKAEFVVPVTTDAKAAKLRVIVRDQGTGRLGSADVGLP